MLLKIFIRVKLVLLIAGTLIITLSFKPKKLTSIMANKFKVGDVVKLKTGSSSMTIKGYANKHTADGLTQIPDKYECMWFDKSKQQKAIFHEDVIELAKH